MRPSSRTDILDATLRVVDHTGADITYDAVAKEAGLTKAGLMYHFATRDALMTALIEYVLDRWKDELGAELEVPFETSTLSDRVRAFVRFAGVGGASGAEFVAFSEAVRRPVLRGPWIEYLRSWFSFGPEVDVVDAQLVWFAVNGLWISEATDIVEVSDAQRQRLLERLEAILDGGPR